MRLCYSNPNWNRLYTKQTSFPFIFGHFVAYFVIFSKVPTISSILSPFFPYLSTNITQFVPFFLQMNGFDDFQGGAANPPLPPHPAGVPAGPKQDYKLLLDPFLSKAPQKVYRYNGIIPNDPNCPSVIVKDPRNTKAIRIRMRVEPMELLVPR